MTLSQIQNLLEGTGLPVAYSHFPQLAAPQLPFICWRVEDSANFSADGVVYHPVTRITVELYCEQKSPETEALVENALASVFWQKYETFIDSENCYQINYEIEV